MTTERPNNMIEKHAGYKVGEAFFSTLREAQVQALCALTDKVPPEHFSEHLVDNADKVIAILSPPKELRNRATRRDKGTKRESKKVSTQPKPILPTEAA